MRSRSLSAGIAPFTTFREFAKSRDWAPEGDATGGLLAAAAKLVQIELPRACSGVENAEQEQR